MQQEVLCRGICSKANYSRIESGGAEIPLVMVQAFLERLGVDPGQLEELLEGEDYGFYRNRRDIEKVLQDGLDAQAGQLLDAYEGAVGEDRLEIQYIKYCRARCASAYAYAAGCIPGSGEMGTAGQGCQAVPAGSGEPYYPPKAQGYVLKQDRIGNLAGRDGRDWLRGDAVQYAGLLAEKGEYGRALAEIRQGLEAVMSGKSYRCCAGCGTHE